MQDNSPENTLLEVRKAYRLLYQYQRRILDLMKYIGNAYQFPYAGGYSKFGDPSPRNGRGSLDSWAWDWLSMYYYEFHYAEKKDKEETIHFSVFLLNDTGYFEANRSDSIHKLTLSKYQKADKSETKLIFVVGKNFWEGWSYDWNDSHFVLDNKGIKENDEGGKMVFKSYSLVDFFDENGAEVNLKDFEDYCSENGVAFKYSPKKI